MKHIILIVVLMVLLTGCAEPFDADKRAERWDDFCKSKNMTYHHMILVPTSPVCVSDDGEIHNFYSNIYVEYKEDNLE